MWLRANSLALLFIFASLYPRAFADEFAERIRPFLETHCLTCHQGDKAKGDVDLAPFLSIADAETDPDLWETVALVIAEGEMPPEDEPQPGEEHRDEVVAWFDDVFFGEIEALPAIHKPRRLSGPEYRNTLRSLLGFDLEVNIMEAEQTVTEKSLVLKLLPTDPPGASGYINDTHAARISTNLWDQYAYLTGSALERLFEDRAELTGEEAREWLLDFARLAYRRPLEDEQTKALSRSIAGLSGSALENALKSEMEVILMSPRFLYRGFLVQPKQGLDTLAQRVDSHELAERLSYFLWEDMPDDELFSRAEDGSLLDSATVHAQIDRMLASPKSRTLATSFGSQWLLLDQIHHERNDPPYLHALKNQPLDFLHYLFTENRPVVEFIDSEVTFMNAYIANYYGSDRKQLTRFVKPRGIERMIMPLQKVTLKESLADRGAGILTMPGVLAMNEGPILRGTWMLRRVLGDHLGEPPPDVPPIQSGPRGESLSFRERFEVHRADQSCALCHDKIDPLGFALEGYDNLGGVIGKSQNGKQKEEGPPPGGIDTSGQLPGGEAFANFEELRTLLLGSQRKKIVRNAVEQMLSYALCRKLERHDRPTVDEITAQIIETNGTWGDLIHAIATSVPFTETRFATDSDE